MGRRQKPIFGWLAEDDDGDENVSKRWPPGTLPPSPPQSNRRLHTYIYYRRGRSVAVRMSSPTIKSGGGSTGQIHPEARRRASLRFLSAYWMDRGGFMQANDACWNDQICTNVSLTGATCCPRNPRLDGWLLMAAADRWCQPQRAARYMCGPDHIHEICNPYISIQLPSSTIQPHQTNHWQH